MFLHRKFLGGKPLSLADSVRANLRHVLGTRRGTGYFLRNFGLSEVGFKTPEHWVATLLVEVRENIRLYEPRVEIVRVEEDFDDDGQRSKIVVELALRGEGDRLDLVFDLQRGALDVVAAPAREGPAR